LYSSPWWEKSIKLGQCPLRYFFLDEHDGHAATKRALSSQASLASDRCTWAKPSQLIKLSSHHFSAAHN
jgi:hypothetical protein